MIFQGEFICARLYFLRASLHMNFFSFDLRKFIFYILVICLPLLSINMEQKQIGNDWYNEPFRMLAGATQNLTYSFTIGVKDSVALYLNLIGIKKESQDLKTTNQKLASMLNSFDELRNENDRLRALLSFKQSVKMELIPARIIGRRDIVADHEALTINKGTNDGLKKGQGVITLGGALGYIFKPTATTAHVLLVTDRYSVVDGIVHRSRAHGIVEGKGSDSCSMKYVDRTEAVKEGDLVVTGGLDNIFPKGYPLATVEKVERKTHSVSLKIELKPIVDPSQVEEVFVISNAHEEDLGSRLPPTELTEETAPAAEPEKTKK